MKTRIHTIVAFTTIAIGGFTLASHGALAGLFSKSEAAETPAAAAVTSSSAEKFRTEQFLRLDGNKDDKLSKDEYVKDMIDSFNNKDEDKDGFLSPDENDFRPGMSAEQKVQERERLMEDAKRRAEMEAEMEKRRAEMDKKMEEERAKREAERKAEQEKAAKEAPKQELKEAPKAEEKKPEEKKAEEKKPADKAADKPADAAKEAAKEPAKKAEEAAVDAAKDAATKAVEEPTSE